MIIASQHIIPKADKRREFLQTLKLLIFRIKKEKGCLSCRFFKDMETNNAFMVLSKWETREEFDFHMQSDSFSILLGAVSLLSELPKFTFRIISLMEETEVMDISRVKEWDNDGPVSSVYKMMELSSNNPI